MKRIAFKLVGLLTLLSLVLAACTQTSQPAPEAMMESLAQVGGPIILMGIDAEDAFGINHCTTPGCQHGPVSVYQDVVDSLLRQVINDGRGILVIGGGKNTTDHVTRFWNAVGTRTVGAKSHTITFVNGATNIGNQSLSGFALIAVASDQFETPSGGLTIAENDALTARASDIANFVNAGGGLLSFSASSHFNRPYGFLDVIGEFEIRHTHKHDQYNGIAPTTEGLAVGITTALNVCCWHDEYHKFPSFLKVLATNTATGKPAAIGGVRVILPTIVPVDIKPTSCRNPLNTNENGVLPVAILGTSTFNVRDVDPTTVRLSNPLVPALSGVAPLRSSLQDVATPYYPLTGKTDAFDCTTAGRDGFLDLVMHFRAQDVLAALGPVSDGQVLVVQLTGKLKDGTNIVGEDVIVILKRK